MRMDPLEKLRRWKRSLDGFITFRKAALIGFCIFVLLLYVGPSFFGWLLGRNQYPSSKGIGDQAVAVKSFVKRRLLAAAFFAHSHSCLYEKFQQDAPDLAAHDAHSLHYTQWSADDHNYLPYVGNGHLGLAVPGDDRGTNDDGLLHIFGYRHLSVRVPFKPVVSINPESALAAAESAAVVHYTHGTVHSVRCFDVSNGGRVSVGNVVYAHRALPNVLVQEIMLSNPTASKVLFNMERLGMANWKGASSKTTT